MSLMLNLNLEQFNSMQMKRQIKSFSLLFLMLSITCLPFTASYAQMSNEDLMFYEGGLTYLDQSSFEQERRAHMRYKLIDFVPMDKKTELFAPNMEIQDSSTTESKKVLLPELDKRRRKSMNDFQAPSIVIPIN